MQPDPVGLPHERTALAWERTAISMIVAGILLARFAAVDAYWILAFIGVAHTAAGAVILIWTGYHYEDLHGVIDDQTAIVHPVGARLVGLSAISLTAAAFVLALVDTISGI
jgi:uncharacterized membrane protein YidH (DUF202 family)